MKIDKASHPPKLPALTKNGRKVGRPEFWTVDKIKPALVQARGIAVRAASILTKSYGVTCAVNTVKAKIAEHEELQRIQKEARDALIDLCEDGVFSRAEMGDQKDQHFLLRHHGKDRGYSTRQEITGPEGGPVQTQEVGLTREQIAMLTDEELDALIAGEQVKVALAERARAMALKAMEPTK